MNRIDDKIMEIESYLEEIELIMPRSLEEYLSGLEKRLACERVFEKIIEAIVDLSFLIIQDRNLKVPEDDKNSFDILRQENIISEKLAEKLKDAKGMRNIIAHEYGKIDDELVFEAVTEQLENDVREFINVIKEAG